jgi:hypothetical protein
LLLRFTSNQSARVKSRARTSHSRGEVRHGGTGVDSQHGRWDGRSAIGSSCTQVKAIGLILTSGQRSSKQNQVVRAVLFLGQGGPCVRERSWLLQGGRWADDRKEKRPDWAAG